MHLTARGEFTAQGTPTHHSLLHPLHLANQILTARRDAMEPNYQQTSLERVEVFRGLPSNNHDSKAYSRSQAQRAEWTRDARVHVTYRPLSYPFERGVQVPREKGVDVLVALKLVELAQTGAYDVVVLAAHDTDLEPAIEVALASEPCKSGKVRVETAGWKNCKRLKPSTGRRIWHTSLAEVNYQAARDRKTY